MKRFKQVQTGSNWFKQVQKGSNGSWQVSEERRGWFSLPGHPEGHQDRDLVDFWLGGSLVVKTQVGTPRRTKNIQLKLRIIVEHMFSGGVFLAYEMKSLGVLLD